ncbi:MAG TPA: hypothetical protein VGK59_11290 [Ohtaekwangia sp.]
MISHLDLTDHQFEQQFKAGTLDVALFNHEAHLRLAWIHVQKYGVHTAITNICEQLLVFVVRHGAEAKFNKTLTIAAIKAVHHFIGRSDASTFEEFILEFPRLKYNFRELMAAHYQVDIYNSAEAKKEFIQPDLLQFDV